MNASGRVTCQPAWPRQPARVLGSRHLPLALEKQYITTDTREHQVSTQSDSDSSLANTPSLQPAVQCYDTQTAIRQTSPSQTAGRAASHCSMSCVTSMAGLKQPCTRPPLPSTTRSNTLAVVHTRPLSPFSNPQTAHTERGAPFNNRPTSNQPGWEKDWGYC